MAARTLRVLSLCAGGGSKCVFVFIGSDGRLRVSATAVVKGSPAVQAEPVILRRAALDEKDRAIIRAVWRAWASGGNVSFREISEATAIPSTGNLEFRIKGWNGQVRRVGGGLIAQGWLATDVSRGQGKGLARTMRPGRRMAGLDASGWPLELV